MAATIRGSFSYNNPKVHDVQVSPHQVVRITGVDADVARVYFIDPASGHEVDAPTGAVWKNLSQNTISKPVMGCFFACWTSDYLLQIDGSNVLELAHQKQQHIKAGKPYQYRET